MKITNISKFEFVEDLNGQKESNVGDSRNVHV